jgi:hypothetical protein
MPLFAVAHIVVEDLADQRMQLERVDVSVDGGILRVASIRVLCENPAHSTQVKGSGISK